MGRTVLVVGAHADDEALGCGGTLARHVAEGDTVHALFMADGVTSRPGASSDEIATRLHAAEAAHRLLGIASVEYLGLADNRMDAVPMLDIVQKLESRLAGIAPELVYTHHYGDLNVDHRRTFQAVLTACRPLPRSSVREIYTFEVLSSTEWSAPAQAPFLPNHFVDITGHLGAKLAAIDAYRLEMRAAPHTRCREHVESLAAHRGHSVGVAAAEAFMAVRVLR